MKVKNTLNYEYEPEKYMFGICEEFEGSLDPASNTSQTVELVFTKRGLRFSCVERRRVKALSRICGRLSGARNTHTCNESQLRSAERARVHREFYGNAASGNGGVF